MSGDVESADFHSSALKNATGVRRKLLLALLSPAQFLDSETLRSLLMKFAMLRVAAMSSFLGTTAWRLFSSDEHALMKTVCLFIASVFFLSIINAFAIRKASRLVLLGHTQLFLDIVLVTFAIDLSGSALSYLLYVLVILAGSLAFGKHGAILISSLSGLSYAVIGSGIIPNFRNHLGTSPQDVLLVYVSFLAVGLVAAYLAEQVQRWSALANRHAQHIDTLSKKNALLLNDISEGIATIDVRGVVIELNSSARDLLQLPPTWDLKLKPRTLPELLKQIGFEFEAAEITDSDGDSGEFELRRGDSSRTMSFVVRNVPGEIPLENEIPHRLFFFSDVSRVKDMEERLELHERMTQLLSQQSPIQSFYVAGSDISMVGGSEIMKQIFQIVEKVAHSDASALISGESGTGKELIARAVHNRSDRKNRAFIAINCGAIPENLIESELFGHKKGSFTGAVNDNPGLFKQANGGTVFLDEIGELPLHLQSKLLRVLQERRVRAVGDVHDSPVDVRIVAATNRDLKKELVQGTFREDLYYRLNVVNIEVPPLRDRREDLPLLIRHFVEKFTPDSDELPKISPEALQLLSNHTFPGNIRELENIIERALVLGGAAILPEHLPEDLHRCQEVEPTTGTDSGAPNTKIMLLPVDLEGELSKIERDLLLRALDQTGGIKKQAAELLGLNFRSFRYRLKKYGMSDGSNNDSDDGAEA